MTIPDSGLIRPGMVSATLMRLRLRSRLASMKAPISRSSISTTGCCSISVTSVMC
ncbi:hypothetical protein D3C79_928020 [compost metagenome]